MLESYLLRRAILNLPTKNYNRIFLGLTRTMRRDGTSPENLQKALLGLSGESTEWPTDEAFHHAWRTQHAYRTLQNPKIVHVLRRLNDTYLNNKSEQINIECPLTVEHLMPQQWIEHWPLPDGSKGMTFDELIMAEKDDPRALATNSREAVLQTFGNLTILTQALNSSVSNSAWNDKKPALLTASLLPINQQLHKAQEWNEDAIAQRSEELFARALQVWPKPA